MLTSELLSVAALGIGGVVVLLALFRVATLIAARPQRGVLLLIALLPFDGLLLLVPAPGFVAGWKELLTLGTLLATLVAPPAARAAQGREIPAWVAPALALVGIGGIWLVVQGPGAIIGFKISFFFLLVPLTLWRCPFNAADRDRLITILMVSVVPVAAIGIVQQILGPDFLVSLGYDWNSHIRTTKNLLRSISTFESPFPFAYYAMTSLALCVPVALADRTRRRNRLFLFATPIVVLGMATAIVRGAFVGIAVAILVMAVYRYRMMVHLFAPVLILLVLLSGQVGGALLSSSSLFERTDRWEDVADRARDRPLGAGLTASGAAADAVAPEAPIKVAETFSLTTKTAVVQPDNYYLKVLVDLGLPGMWMMVLLVYFALRYAWRTAHEAEGADAAMAAGICAALFAAAAAASVSTYWEIFPAELLFWTLLGVLPSLSPSSDSTLLLSVPTEAESRPTSKSFSAALFS